MPKIQSQKRSRQAEQEQAQRQRRVISVILILAILALFVLIGYNDHPTCTQHCQNSPAYFYGIQIPHTSYSQFYGTDDGGNSVHTTSEDDNGPGHVSNSNDAGDDFHGSSFHGGEP